jgi:hypothetical protein
MKYSNYTIGNQTLDLPACSAVPQPTASPRASQNINKLANILQFPTMFNLPLPTNIYVNFCHIL